MTILTYDGPDSLPKHLRFYGASDMATMEPKKGKKEPDFTEHGVWGIDTIGDLWAVDWWFGQKETDKSIAAWIQLIKRWKPIKWWDEGGLIDKAIGPAKREAMRRNNAFVSVESLSSILDKGAKLQGFHARYTARTVHFPQNAWGDRVIDQLVKFPAGRWDDAADVCGLIGRGLDMMVDAIESKPQTKPQLIPFTQAWLEYNDRPVVKERFF